MFDRGKGKTRKRNGGSGKKGKTIDINRSGLPARMFFALKLACVAGGFLVFFNFYYRTRAEKIKEGAKRRRGKCGREKPPAEKP